MSTRHDGCFALVDFSVTVYSSVALLAEASVVEGLRAGAAFCTGYILAVSTIGARTLMVAHIEIDSTEKAAVAILTDTGVRVVTVSILWCYRCNLVGRKALDVSINSQQPVFGLHSVQRGPCHPLRHLY